MKYAPLILSLLPLAAMAQEDTPLPDPTRAGPRMKAALAATTGTALPPLTMKGLVMTDSRERASVMLGAGEDLILARPGSAFLVNAGGSARAVKLKSIGAGGVTVEVEGSETPVLVSGYGPSDNDPPAEKGAVRFVLFRELPLIDALRMLSDQTGANFSASVESNRIPVSCMLRGVPAPRVVEEICRSHGLWFKQDAVSGIMRIMTTAEFEKDLVGFREEQTEVFTLKFPNVTEIATGIADLFGDRVQLSLGADEADNDMRRDLESRFDRFDVLTQRTRDAALSTSGGNVIGGNVNGFYSNGSGTTGFGGLNGGYGGSGSRGGYGESRYGDSQSLRRENRQGVDGTGTRGEEEVPFRDITPEQAGRIDRALAARPSDPAAQDLDALRARPATIFVTASRRNNMVVVRTADSRAMDDIRALIARMDVQTPLVLLEVSVVTVELGTDFRSAFDYQFSDGRRQGSFSRENVPVPLTGGNISGTGLNSSDMSFTIADGNFRARMQMFEQQNRIRVVATPTLLTANNEISRLFLGEERPLVRSINSQTIITDNNVATTPNTTTEFRNVGNTLLITPNINSDRTVTLRLVQENSSINPGGGSIPVVTNSSTGNTSVQNVPVDTVQTRSISGTFVARDGMVIAAGGMIETENSTRRGQVPVIGSVPVVGWFFRREEDVVNRREIVVVMRPRILSTPADGARIGEESLRLLAPHALERLRREGILPAPAAPAAAVPSSAAPSGKKSHSR